MNPVLYMQRLLSRCEECGDCLLWTGPSTDKGYPRVYARVGSKSLRRLIWQMREGPIPDGAAVVTTCDRPNCVQHLGLSTKAAVLAEVIQRPEVRAKRSSIGRARMRAIAPKLTMEKAREIRSSSKTQVQLAAEYRIGQSMVSAIRTGKRWSEPSPFSGLGAR